MSTSTNKIGKPIRIVQVKEDSIDYSVLLAKNALVLSTPTPTVTPMPSPTITCPPEEEPKFTKDQLVVTTDALKVRENPGLSSPEIKTQSGGTSGTILGGPACQDNYVWWKVEYQFYLWRMDQIE